MTIKEIIQKLHTTMIDARGQESHFESWMTQNEGICDAIDALKALDKQEPVAWRVWNPDGEKQYAYSENGDGEPLYTTPPKRKPLSVEKILHLVDTHVGAPSMSYPLDNNDWINFARAIEAAHGIKE